MWVYRQEVNAMRQGSGEVGRHLPTPYRTDKRQLKVEPWHLRIVVFICFTSCGSDPPSLSFNMFITFACSGLHQTLALFNSIVMVGANWGRTEGDKCRLNNGIAMEPLLLCRSGYGLYGVGSCDLKGATKLELWFGSPEESSPSIPWLLSRASGTRLDDYLIFPCSAIVIARPCVHTAAIFFTMSRPRHRMRYCRGTPRRAPSIPSSNYPSLSSEFISIHYPRTCSGGGRLHLPIHYPEPRSPNSTSSPWVIWLCDFHLKLLSELPMDYSSSLSVLSWGSPGGIV